MNTPISSITEYLYCPLKLYLKQNIKLEEINPKKENYQLHGKIRKQILKEYRNSVKKNFRIIQNDMNASEISQCIYQDVPYILRKVIHEYHLNPSKETEFIEDIENDIKYQNTILALEINQMLDKGQDDPDYLSETLFPPAIENYIIKNQELGLSGMIDRIEVVDGTYYPIKQKNSQGPLRGVWDGDAIELAAYSILLEYEFDTEILVGFINYRSIYDKRPVVINTKLREKLQDILHSIFALKKGSLPQIKVNLKKCEKCDYYETCKQNIEFT